MEQEPKNESELLDFFLEMINVRNTHKEKSREIARYAFDKTHPQMFLNFR